MPTPTCLTPDEALALYRRDLEASLRWAVDSLHGMRCGLDHFGAGLLDRPDSEIKVWSDLHFGHAATIERGRPFASVTEMDTALWDAWAAEATPEHALLCVGDVVYLLEEDEYADEVWERVRAASGGENLLVIGNHDMTDDGELRATGFDRTLAVLVSPGDPPLIFTHAPLPRVPAGHINVHGHMHDGLMPDGSPHINVSVEQIEYRPTALSRVRRLAGAMLGGTAVHGDTTLERIRSVERAARS